MSLLQHICIKLNEMSKNIFKVLTSFYLFYPLYNMLLAILLFFIKHFILAFCMALLNKSVNIYNRKQKIS